MKLTDEELCDALRLIAHRLHTQDNLATQDPVYCVQEKKARSMGTWVTVQSFLTSESAKDYIANRAYRHSGPLRVYAESAYANWELRAIRQYLMESFTPGTEANAALEEK